jgi:hypothetical protein
MNNQWKNAFALLAVAGIGATAQAQFSGDYAPGNWTINDVAGGSVNTAGAPASVVLTSGDISIPGDTSFTIAATDNGDFSFDWQYFSSDSGCFDVGGYVDSGAKKQLACNQDSPASGSVVANICEGQQMGFYVNTLDGIFGPGVLTISNFGHPDGTECEAPPKGGCDGGDDRYSNGAGPDYANGNEMTQWAQAEDFVTGADSTISRVGYSVLDLNNNGLANWDGTIQYIIFEGDPNLGNIVGSGDGQKAVAAFDQNAAGWDFYDVCFDLESPVDVNGGTTYWLALHMGQDFVFDGHYWSTQFANGTSPAVESNGSFNGPWNSNGLEHYFTLGSGAGDECIGDCDGNGALNILDFVCFQGEWQNQTDKGDCDGNGQFNILDFVCFQGEWQAGCP